MNINDSVNVKDITLADIHVALFGIEQQFNAALGKGDLKGAVELAKRYIKLSNLASKRSAYASKNGINDPEVDDVQKKIAEEIQTIMIEEEFVKNNRR